jgi:hypothetical protein
MDKTDIVKRLTDIASLRGPMGGRIIPDACMDAVFEIQRLQAENTSLRHAISEQNRLNRLTNITGKSHD